MIKFAFDVVLLFVACNAFQRSGFKLSPIMKDKYTNNDRGQSARLNRVSPCMVASNNVNAPDTALSKASRLINKLLLISALLYCSTSSPFPSFAADSDSSIAATQSSVLTISRDQVGTIDLNEKEPVITDICWLDIELGGSIDSTTSSESSSSAVAENILNKDDPVIHRIDIALFGNEVPKTVNNFKQLAQNTPGYGYRNSEIFRIISTFSVQGGNIQRSAESIAAAERTTSLKSKEGHAADDIPFPAENFRILHQYKEAGVVSMMKDILKQGQQDSRFFISLSPDAGWADGKYSAFGRVIHGMNFIEGLQVVPVKPPFNYPLTKVLIKESGCYEPDQLADIIKVKEELGNIN